MNLIGRILQYSRVTYGTNISAIVNKSVFVYLVLLKSNLKLFFAFEFFLFILIELVIELRTWPLPLLRLTS